MIASLRALKCLAPAPRLPPTLPVLRRRSRRRARAAGLQWRCRFAPFASSSASLADKKSLPSRDRVREREAQSPLSSSTQLLPAECVEQCEQVEHERCERDRRRVGVLPGVKRGVRGVRGE